MRSSTPIEEGMEILSPCLLFCTLESLTLLKVQSISAIGLGDKSSSRIAGNSGDGD